MRICSMPNCSKPAHAKGMCTAHYTRWLRYGDPKTTLIPMAPKGEPLRYLLAHMRDGCCTPWPYATVKGYPRLMDNDGCLRYGANLVCELVNGPCPPNHECCHNCGFGHLGCFNADCLEWKLHVENVGDSIEHETWVHGESSGTTVLPTKDVERLRMMRATGNYTYAELGEIFGISLSQARRIVIFESRKDG